MKTAFNRFCILAALTHGGTTALADDQIVGDDNLRIPPAVMPVFITTDSTIDAESRVFEYRRLGNAALHSGFYDAAAIYYADYVKSAQLWPALHEDALLSLAEAHIFAKRFDDGEALLRQVAKLPAPSATSMARTAVLRARIELGRNAPAKALSLIEPWLQDASVDTAVRADGLAVVIAVRQGEVDWASASEASAELLTLLNASGVAVPEQLTYAMNRQIYFDIRRGAYPRAVRLLSLQKPSTPLTACEHQLLRAFYACANGYLDSAVEYYHAARLRPEFQLSPLTTGIAYEIAERFNGARRISDAEEMLNDALGTTKSLAMRQKIMRRIAEIQIASGNRPAAIATLTRYLHLYGSASDVVPTAVELANLQLAGGQDREAFATYRRLLEHASMADTVRVDVLRRFARLLSDKGQYDDARKALTEMIGLSKDSDVSGEGMYLIAETMVRQRRNAQALEVYSKLTANPIWREQALYRKMIVEAELNLNDEALKTIEIIFADAKDTEILTDAQFYHPHILARAGKYAEAAVAFRRFVERAGEGHARMPDALLELGEAYMKLHKYGDAFKSFAELLKRYPRSPNAPRGAYQQIYAAYLDGDGQSAVRIAQDFQRRWANSAYASEALFWLSDYYLAESGADSALTVLRVINELPGAEASVKARALLERANVLYSQGLTDSALAEMTRLAVTYPEHPHMQLAGFLEGEIHTAKNDFRHAMAAYQRAYQVGSDSALTLAAAGRIGDCLTTMFSMTAELDEKVLREAEAWYGRILATPAIPSAIAVQTYWKLGHLYRLLQENDKAVAYLMRPLLMYQEGMPIPKASEVWLVKSAESLLDIYGKQNTPEAGAKGIQICRMMIASKLGPEEYWRNMIRSIEQTFSSVPALPEALEAPVVDTPRRGR